VSNVLPLATRVLLASALSEGNSIRATSRMTGVDKNAAMEFGLRVGEGCIHLHNRLVRGLAAYSIQADEQHSFISKKEAHLEPGDPEDFGEIWTYVALDAVTKMVIAFAIGKRDQLTTDAFIADVRARVTVVPRFTTDGLDLYPSAIKKSFGASVDYAQLVKHYDRKPRGNHDDRFPLPEQSFVTKTVISGSPDLSQCSTSHVERFNLSTRHTVGRKRRRCLAFSKTVRGHRAAVGLSFAAYNFCKIDGSLDETPAMAAKLTDHPWTMEELVTAALAEEPTAAPVAQPLALPAGHGAARQLPNGGWLRVVDSKGVPATLTPAPVAPAVPSVEASAVASSAAPVDDRQLDLLAWAQPAKPLPPKGQLSLFDDD